MGIFWVQLYMHDRSPPVVWLWESLFLTLLFIGQWQWHPQSRNVGIEYKWKNKQTKQHPIQPNRQKQKPKKALKNKNHTNEHKGTVTNYKVIVKQNFNFIVHVLIHTGKKNDGQSLWLLDLYGIFVNDVADFKIRLGNDHCGKTDDIIIQAQLLGLGDGFVTSYKVRIKVILSPPPRPCPDTQGRSITFEIEGLYDNSVAVPILCIIHSKSWKLRSVV